MLRKVSLGALILTFNTFVTASPSNPCDGKNIGDMLNGGYVFSIDPCKIVSTENAEGSHISWSNPSNDPSCDQSDAYDITEGQINQARILTCLAGSHNAVDFCTHLSVYTSGAQNGYKECVGDKCNASKWYLPAVAELSEITALRRYGAMEKNFRSSIIGHLQKVIILQA